ncbi:hypothetical protein QL285_031440 [Trifolium repens]|nr:hypothetical protein QL285_031440 [Trifolium repens]
MPIRYKDTCKSQQIWEPTGTQKRIQQISTDLKVVRESRTVESQSHAANHTPTAPDPTPPRQHPPPHPSSPLPPPPLTSVSTTTARNNTHWSENRTRTVLKSPQQKTHHRKSSKTTTATPKLPSTTGSAPNHHHHIRCNSTSSAKNRSAKPNELNYCNLG